MPRAAPVTTATFPVKSNIAFRSPAHRRAKRHMIHAKDVNWMVLREESGHLFDAGRGLEARERRLAIDLPDQAAQHGARTHFNILADALGCKPPHNVYPPDRRRHLPHKRLDRG